MIQSTVYTAAGGTRKSPSNLCAIVVRAQLPYNHQVDRVGAIGPSGLTGESSRRCFFLRVLPSRFLYSYAPPSRSLTIYLVYIYTYWVSA